MDHPVSRGQRPGYKIRWRGPVAEAPAEAAEWIEQLRPPEISVVRWDTVEVRVSAVPRAQVTFRMAGIEASAQVVNGAVRPTSGVTAPYRVRVLGAVVLALAGLGWGTGVSMAYVGRHVHYLLTSNAGYLSLLVPAFGIAGIFLAGAVLGPQSKLRLVSLVGSTAGLLGLLGVQAGFAFTGHPALADAEALHGRGDPDGAEAIARACVDLEIEAPGARAAGPGSCRAGRRGD